MIVLILQGKPKSGGKRKAAEAVEEPEAEAEEVAEAAEAEEEDKPAARKSSRARPVKAAVEPEEATTTKKAAVRAISRLTR